MEDDEMLLMQSQPTLTNDASNGILHELNNLSNFSHSSTESALELKLLMIDKVEAPSSQFWDFKALQVVGKLNQPDFQILECSDNNLISFSSLSKKKKTSGITYRANKRARMENIVTDSREDVYCVFIFHPNCVDEYAIINTPHSQIIKFIKFCPSGLGNFILLCDGVQKITLWKMMKNIESWILVRSFEQSCVVNLFWLAAKPMLNPKQDGATKLEDKFPLRNTGDIKGIPFGMPSFLTINPFGLVHVHYCKNSNATNDYWNSIKFSLKFPNNLFISHADILINEEGQVSLFLAPSSGNCIHIYDINLDLYGPKTSGNGVLMNRIFVSLTPSFLTLSKELILIRFLKLFPSKENVLFTILSTATNKCQLTRLEYFEKLNSEGLLESSWTESQSIFLENSDIVDIEVECFITSFSISPNGKLIALTHISGTIEIRDSVTLNLLDTIILGKEPNGKFSPIPLFASFSPNSCCLNIFDHLPRVQIFSLDKIIFNQSTPMEQSRELIDLLEQSLIRNQDNWDILMNYPKLYRQPLISSSSFLIWNLIHIGKDLQSIPDQKLRISTKMLLDRIQSLILYCSSGQEVNFMDSQIRLSLFWTLQIFRDSFPQPVTNSIKEVFEKKKPFKTFLETDYQSLFARNIARFQPFADWTLKFCTFFIKNLMYFALKFQNATASETLMNSTNIPQNLPSDIPSSIFCSIYWVIEESMAIPCVSMLFDHDMLVVYQEILLYMISFLKSSQTIFLTNFQLVSQFHSPQNTCTSNFLQFPRCFPQASTRILEVLQKLQIKPQITEMKELETFLDLNPPKIGYFARKKSHSYLTNLNLESQTDVSSRNLLDSRQSYRCIKCNRLTNSLIERACPICGGNWKFQFFNLK